MEQAEETLRQVCAVLRNTLTQHSPYSGSDHPGAAPEHYREVEALDESSFTWMPGTRVQAICIQALLMALAVILLLAGLSAHGESYQFRTFQRPEGLENLNIRSLTQASNGQLWLGTENGVYRFDGARMTHIATFEDHDLPFIQAIQEDNDKRMWVSNTHELVYLDAQGLHHPGLPRFGLQETALNSIAVLPGDHDQIFFMADQQVFRISSPDGGKNWHRDPVFDAATLAAHPELKKLGALETSVPASGDGQRLWMSCDHHLCSAKPDGKALQIWGADQGVPEDVWQQVFSDHRGHIWARGLAHIVSLTPGAGSFALEDHGLTPKMLNMRLLSITEDPQGRILTNTASGLARLEGDHWHLFGSENNLPENMISNLMFDQQGSLWFARNGHGLMRWVGYGNWEQWKERDGLGVSQVWGMAQDRRGDLWVATDLDLVHLPEGADRRAEPQASGHPMRQAESVIVDPAGHIWVGDNAGNVKVYDPVTHNARLVASQLSSVNSLFLGPDNTIWVCAKKGPVSVGAQRRLPHA